MEPPPARHRFPYVVHENDNGTFDVYDTRIPGRDESVLRMLPTRLDATIRAERLAMRLRPGVLVALYMDRKRRGDLLGY